MTQTKKTIVVTPYNPAWVEHFQQICEYIWPHVKDYALAIEHVGSTAVPGLAAKPVIDLDIIISDEAVLEHMIKQLEPLGYTYRGTLGIAGRYAFQQFNDLPQHHLYVCPQGSLGVRNHLTLRDYLRSNPGAVQRYGELKQQLAQQFPNDIDSYVDGKTALITSFLQAAGIEQQELQAIEQANRLSQA